MDTTTIATSAATALIMGFANRLGEKTAEKVGDLKQMIKTKFEGDSYAEQTLSRAEEKPDAIKRKAALEDLLTEKMEEDPDFAEKVHKLVEEVRTADTENVIAHGEHSVAISGDVKGSTIITGDSNVVGGRRSLGD